MSIDGPAPLRLDLDGWRDLDDIRRQVAAHPEASLRLARDLRRPDPKRMRRSPLPSVAVVGIVTLAFSAVMLLAVLALVARKMGW